MAKKKNIEENPALDSQEIVESEATPIPEPEVIPIPEPEVIPTLEPKAVKMLHVGFQDPTHKFFWIGTDINGNTHIGSGNDASKCNVEAGLQGSSTCHLSLNPAYIEPEIPAPAPSTDDSPSELNRFYQAGYQDGLKYFEDLKALVQAWVTEQALSGGVADVDSLPFVVYARHNP
jgi:hypothetical protein